MHTSLVKSRNEGGFTLIELLITAIIVGILSGTLVSVINYQRHRRNTDNAVRRTTLQKLQNVVETYRTSENLYPTDGTVIDGNPDDDPLIGTYLVDAWPNDEPQGAVYTYWVNAARTTVGITVNTNDNTFYKYRTAWGNIRECGPTAVPSDNVCPAIP
jgi:prepilin-type N-terminal cleavage/methylation domain-containing protein